MRLLRARSAGSAHGQALVETALIIPLVLLLSLATFDLGRGIHAHIALTEATQEGALYAGYLYGHPDTPVSEADVRVRVRESSSADIVTTAVVDIVGCADAPGYVTVRSTSALPILTPIGNLVFGPTFTLAVELDATNLQECP